MGLPGDYGFLRVWTCGYSNNEVARACVLICLLFDKYLYIPQEFHHHLFSVCGMRDVALS